MISVWYCNGTNAGIKSNDSRVQYRKKGKMSLHTKVSTYRFAWTTGGSRFTAAIRSDMASHTKARIKTNRETRFQVEGFGTLKRGSRSVLRCSSLVSSWLATIASARLLVIRGWENVVCVGDGEEERELLVEGGEFGVVGRRSYLADMVVMNVRSGV